MKQHNLSSCQNPLQFWKTQMTYILTLISEAMCTKQNFALFQRPRRRTWEKERRTLETASIPNPTPRPLKKSIPMASQKSSSTRRPCYSSRSASLQQLWRLSFPRPADRAGTSVATPPVPGPEDITRIVLLWNHLQFSLRELSVKSPCLWSLVWPCIPCLIATWAQRCFTIKFIRLEIGINFFFFSFFFFFQFCGIAEVWSSIRRFSQIWW